MGLRTIGGDDDSGKCADREVRQHRKRWQRAAAAVVVVACAAWTALAQPSELGVIHGTVQLRNETNSPQPLLPCTLGVRHPEGLCGPWKSL